MEKSTEIIFKLIVAVCEGNGIGKNNTLPWKLKSELSYFARMTKTTEDPSKQNAVIMGRKTLESIPEKFRPLKGRLNVVLTRSSKQDICASDNSSVLVCKSLEDAIKCLENIKEDNKIESCWVIGGAGVYAEAMRNDRLQEIYLTRILEKFDCDTFFPDIPADEWKITSDDKVNEKLQEENGTKFQYQVFKRII